jgi:hypothetical protein
VIQAAYSNVSTGTGLQAQYYNDHSEGAYPLANPFAGTPVLTRTDPTVDFSWGEGCSRLAGRRKQLLRQVDWSTEGARLGHLHLHGHRTREN